jgi:REP element-mobilizing transposase RayT
MSRPHRLHADVYVAGYRFFLTVCTYRRRRYFEELSVIDLVRVQFLQTSVAEGAAILAYCFMPDHLHAVVECDSGRTDFARFVRSAKQRAGFYFSRSRQQPLWQDSFFDRTLRQDEALADVVRYMIGNPVRAGLVGAPEEYPHWGSEVYSRQELLEFVQMARRV